MGQEEQGSGGRGRAEQDGEQPPARVIMGRRSDV